MNDDTHPANMDVKRLAPSTASLAGVLSLGAGFMSPAFAVVPPADCVLGQAVTTGSCKLDVNGGGADLTVGVFGTTQSQGYLSAYNSSPMSFLLGSAVVGKPALLKLSAGDSVEASDFVSGASGSGGCLYGRLHRLCRLPHGGHWRRLQLRLARAGARQHDRQELRLQPRAERRGGIPGVSAVLEASGLALMAVGAAGILALRRRQPGALTP